jgi:iron complex transport system permease protein
VSALVLGPTLLLPVATVLGPASLPVLAIAGGLTTTLVLYRIATRQGRTAVATMLLAGLGLAALATALTGTLIFMSDDRQLRDVTFWTLGSLGGATWTRVASILPVAIGVAAVVPFIARGLNAIVLGEAAARHLGIRVQRLKRLAILLIASATGAAVSVSGVIGFVGIVVPHLLRLTVGPDHRFLLPASAIAGAALLVAADMISRTIVAPAELPIGIVMAAIGAPVFLCVLLRRRSLIDP